MGSEIGEVRDTSDGEIMKNSRIATIAVVVALATGCSQRPDDKTAASVDALKQQVQSLTAKLQEAQQKQTDLAARITKLEFWQLVETDNSIALDPASKAYGVAKTNLGNLLISVDNVSPYGDGYKVRLMVGNPNMVTFDGASLKVRWAEKPQWGAQGFNYAKWSTSVQEKDVDIPNTLLPGTWNSVEVVLSPATASQTGYLAVTATLNKLELRRGFPN